MEKNISFNGDLDSAIYYGNKEMMQHLWLNLLDNAIKYTPNGGDITVSVTQINDAITVKITDTGIGMNEQTKRFLFDPYFQGDSSHSQQGLGLGLSIAKRIVELCGGTIIVDSEETVGTTFTITLPVNSK